MIETETETEIETETDPVAEAIVLLRECAWALVSEAIEALEEVRDALPERVLANVEFVLDEVGRRETESWAEVALDYVEPAAAYAARVLYARQDLKRAIELRRVAVALGGGDGDREPPARDRSVGIE